MKAYVHITVDNWANPDNVSSFQARLTWAIQGRRPFPDREIYSCVGEQQKCSSQWQATTFSHQTFRWAHTAAHEETTCPGYTESQRYPQTEIRRHVPLHTMGERRALSWRLKMFHHLPSHVGGIWRGSNWYEEPAERSYQAILAVLNGDNRTE